MPAACLLTAFSVMNSRCAIATLDLAWAAEIPPRRRSSHRAADALTSPASGASRRSSSGQHQGLGD
jgi:hypothetical protein